MEMLYIQTSWENTGLIVEEFLLYPLRQTKQMFVLNIYIKKPQS